MAGARQRIQFKEKFNPPARLLFSHRSGRELGEISSVFDHQSQYFSRDLRKTNAILSRYLLGALLHPKFHLMKAANVPRNTRAILSIQYQLKICTMSFQGNIEDGISIVQML